MKMMNTLDKTRRRIELAVAQGWTRPLKGLGLTVSHAWIAPGGSEWRELPTLEELEAVDRASAANTAKPFKGTPIFCSNPHCGRQWVPISKWQQENITLCTSCREKALEKKGQDCVANR